MPNDNTNSFTDDTKTLSAVIMASGHGHRFGENKLLFPIDGISMAERLFRNIPKDLFRKIIVVSKYDEILTMSEKYGYIPVLNDDTTDDIAKTISLGITAALDSSAGCMFFVADQPWLTAKTIGKLAAQFQNDPKKIHIPLCDGQRGNPVIFPRWLFPDLDTLPPHHSGKYLFEKYPQAISHLIIADPLELKDVDAKTDLLSSSL